MKTVELSAFGIEHLHVVERAEPTLKEQDVLVQIEAVSLNYLDLALIKGVYKPDLAFPAIPTSDGSGTVLQVGNAVTRWKPGDRVTVHFKQDWLSGPTTAETEARRVGVTLPGVLAQRVVLPEHGLVRTPDSLTAEEASTLPIAGLTAWSGLLDEGNLQIGQTLLVQGTGGVSLAALQLAKASGARVIATTSSDEKAQKLRTLGADHVINYRQTPNWEQSVLELTAGKGADITLDVAGTETFTKSMQAVKQNGFVGIVGFLSGTEAPMNLYIPVLKSLTLRGLSVGSRQAFEQYLQALTVMQIKPVIDRVFPIEQVQDAFRYFESGQHFGKVVIRL
ncbi:zinc-dependent alcohol dehydrogenase family protein [Spirosoma arboris]|nr:NAD(P)-dependent alcohol dehydrogenase [Spirosoma arboris]